MSIVLKKISKTFGAVDVIENASLSLNLGEKIAVVGENGVGKTTLLKILAGKEESTTGTVIHDEYSVAIYVAQEFPKNFIESGLSVKDYVDQHGGDKLGRGVTRILGDFDMDNDFLNLKLEHLSGGQKKILEIATAFAQKPQYLLIDEPENHIDIFGRQILIDMMQNFRGCLVFVSHDQDLINSVTNRIIEIDNGQLHSYLGTYEYYLEERKRQKEARIREYKRYEEEAVRLDILIKRMREWVKKNPDLGPMLRSKKTQLQRLHDNAPGRPNVGKSMKLSMGDVERKNKKRILQVEDFSLRLGSKTLFYKTNAYLFFGEKIGIVGRNGTGKSSFFKAILGELSPTEGQLKVGVGLNIGYFSQDHQEMLDDKKTPIQLLNDIVREPEHVLRSRLAQFLIDYNSCNRPVSTLSGGQKTRLRFCLLFNKKHDFLLLDEPTNHLDPISWDILIQAVQDFNGTVLLISHDRVFIDQVSTKLWIVEDRQINEYLRSLTEYLSES